MQRWWQRLVDDFGCALFGPVLFVTLSYYGLQFLPLDPLYGDDYQVVCVTSSVLNLLCLLFRWCFARFCHFEFPFQLFRSLHMQLPLAPLVLMVCLCHILVLNCSLYPESVLTGLSSLRGMHSINSSRPATQKTSV